MTTIAFTGEEHARPAKRVTVHYKRSGEHIKLKVKEALYAALMDSKQRIGAATGKDFTQSVMVRMALEMYLSRLAKLSDEQLVIEAGHLMAKR